MKSACILFALVLSPIVQCAPTPAVTTPGGTTKGKAPTADEYQSMTVPELLAEVKKRAPKDDILDLLYKVTPVSVRLQFRNALEYDLKIYWENTDGDHVAHEVELLGKQQQPRGVEVDAFHGHKFVVKNPADGQILKTVIANGAKGDEQMVTIHRKVDISIINEMNADVELYYADDDGVSKKHGVLSPGRTEKFVTFHGHEFVVKTLSGAVIKKVVVDRANGDPQYVHLQSKIEL
jgi:hypothetical protein